MARSPNVIYVDDKGAFLLVHLDPEDERAFMDGLKELGIEAETETVYCG